MITYALYLFIVLSALALPAWVYGRWRIRRYRLRGGRRLLALLPAMVCTAGVLALLSVIIAGLIVSSAMTW
ncbi:MAG: hypothetical protein IJK64_05720 [Clostridia bacterium]|nr:hypothetical protein [Clostridia bacterium]